MAWISFGTLPCRKKMMKARVSMLLKSRGSVTCFRVCFLPGRAKDSSAPRYNVVTNDGCKQTMQGNLLWNKCQNHYVPALSRIQNGSKVTLHSMCNRKVTFLPTYSTVQSPFWETNRFAASQEIPHISRNPEVHYCTHKRPPPVSILGQANPVHLPTSYLLEIHPNIIHPSTPRSPQCSPSLRFPHQGPINSPLLTHTRHMPSPSHSSRFYHPHNIE